METSVPNRELRDGIINKIVKPERRITRNVLTREEMAACIGYRATQISRGGSEIFVDITQKNMNEPINIATRELEEGKFPLKLWRYVGAEGNTWFWEEFDINTMTKVDINTTPETNI